MKAMGGNAVAAKKLIKSTKDSDKNETSGSRKRRYIENAAAEKEARKERSEADPEREKEARRERYEADPDSRAQKRSM